MSQALTQLRDGCRLFSELDTLLETEQAAMVRHDAAGMDQAVLRFTALLADIEAWEQSTRGLVDTGGRLSGLPAHLPPPERAEAEQLVGEIRRRALAAREKAAVNHILVSRSLDTVRRTVRYISGASGADTYNSQGDVDHARPGLVTRKG